MYAVDEQSVVEMDKCNIFGNEAREGVGGGGIMMQSGTFTAINSTIANNIAEYKGAGVSLDGADVNMTLISCTICYNYVKSNAEYGYGGALHQVWPAYFTAFNTTLSYNLAKYGAAMYLVKRHANDDRMTVMSSCVVTDNNSTTGGSIYITQNSTLEGYNLTVIRNLGGINSFGNVTLDSGSTVCRNLEYQVNGTVYGTARICGGTITSVVHNEHNDTLYPGSDITVSGSSMLADHYDVILHASRAFVGSNKVPFTFQLPLRYASSRHPLYVVSAADVRSESFNSYLFEISTTPCPVTLVTAPTPLSSPVFRSVPITIGIQSQCNYAPEIRCVFGSVVVEAYTSMKHAICMSPVPKMGEAVTLLIEAIHPAGNDTLFSGMFQYDCGEYDVEIGYKKLLCNDTQIGSVCKLGCDDGYSGNVLDPVCEGDYEWSPSSGCQRMYCNCDTHVSYSLSII